jgi:hypothetical protein
MQVDQSGRLRKICTTIEKGKIQHGSQASADSRTLCNNGWSSSHASAGNPSGGPYIKFDAWPEPNRPGRLALPLLALAPDLCASVGADVAIQ